MHKFKKRLFATKSVSVWGMGYLGYTTILRLQSNGFFVNCFTLDKNIQEDIRLNKYPYDYMKQTWSLSGNIPNIDFSMVSFCSDFKDLFEVRVHVIAIPAFDKSGTPENYSKLVDIFSKYADKLNDSLVLFQSAEKAGTVENFFIKPLKKIGIKCHFASSFRSDWSIEEFISGTGIRVLAANDKNSLDVACDFFDILNINFKTLGSIEEAEVYENAKNCMKYSIEAFFAQLSLAYPSININEVSAMIVKNLDLSIKRSGLNVLKHKNMLNIDHILAGQNGDYLSIVKEAQAVNISMVLFYADILKQKKISSITIMGLSVEGAKKDIRASAAVLLAEYLRSGGMSIFVHDPYFSKEEINEILPFVTASTLCNKSEFTESYVIIGSNPVYNYFTQKDIDTNGIFEAKIIIDSMGMLRHFSFSTKTIYHEVGDGGLKALLQ